MFLHHLLRCSTHPGQPVWSQQVTQSSPPAICRDDRNFSRVIPAAGNHWTASVPQPWQRSLAQGLHSRVTQTWHPWLCATGTSLPGDPESALDMGHRSTEDLSCIVPIWIRNDLLRALGELLCWGGDVVQSRALGTGRKNHSQGIRNNPATVKGKWAG